MKLYSIDVMIYGTAYVLADSPAEARFMAKAMAGDTFELPEGEYGDVVISGKDLDSDDLPELSLSPAFTIHGPHEDDQVEEVE